MPSCVVLGCNSNNRLMKGTEIKFYTFPKNKDLALQWIQACRRQEKINLKNAVICSKHFESNCFFVSLKYRLLNETPPKRFRNLLSDAIPTLFLPEDRTVASPCSTNNPNQNLKIRLVNIEDILSGASYNSHHKQTAAEQVVEDSSINRSELLKEMKNMKSKMLSLEKKVELLKLKNEELINDKVAFELELSRYKTALSNYFGPEQIKQILNPNKKYSLSIVQKYCICNFSDKSNSAISEKQVCQS